MKRFTTSSEVATAVIHSPVKNIVEELLNVSTWLYTVYDVVSYTVHGKIFMGKMLANMANNAYCAKKVSLPILISA